jgi:hypothetical protein
MMIRLATVMDLSELYHMLYVMHSETSHNLSPIVSEKLTTAISMSLHRGVVLVAESRWTYHWLYRRYGNNRLVER